MALFKTAAGPSPIIRCDELATRLDPKQEKPRIIDVREPFEFAAGHVPGSENIPLDRIPLEFHKLKKDEELVLVCRSGNRSGMAQRFLQGQGFTKTRNLVNGILGWTGPTE